MINTLIEHGFKMLGSATKLSQEKNEKFDKDLFIFLTDKEHEVLGTITLMRNLNIVFSGCSDKDRPIPVTIKEFEEILKNAHMVSYEFSSLKEALGERDIEDLIKRLRNI